MDKARLRPLASSLDPLPGESLSGFLLRTAYRLERSPARIAKLTGLLTTDGQTGAVPLALLLDLAPERRASFAAAARLTQAEAASLCLSAFAGRYPAAGRTPDIPAAPQAPKRANTVPHTRAQRWLSGPVRWCPECLAGDGTPLQNQLGGAWSKSWWLPVVFACIRHRRLLEHSCPGCSGLMTQRRRTLAAIPNAAVSGVHPACCRLPAPGSGTLSGPHALACGAPLTAPSPRATPAGPALDLQLRILRLLDPAQPGETASAGYPATAAQYFTDLRLISSLVRASWPLASEFTDAPAPLGELVGSDSRRAARGKPGRAAFNDPPEDAAASAALLTVADQLLSRDARDLARHVLDMLANDPRTAHRATWTRGFLRERPDCSAGLFKAITPAVQGHVPRPGQHIRMARGTSVYPAGYEPTHIAQFLQDDWYQRYLSDLGGVNPILLRRAAALYLCQLAAGGSIADAAELLGIPYPRRAYTSSSSVLRWARARPDPREFENAVHGLGDHLSQSGRLIDYGRRRLAMTAWCIGPGDWSRILSRLGPYHSRAGNLQMGERRRQTASVIAWTRITQGEYLFAPRPIQDQQPPEARASWRLACSAAWSRIQSNRLLPVEAGLYPILYAYADELAARIDDGEQPVIQ